LATAARSEGFTEPPVNCHPEAVVSTRIVMPVLRAIAYISFGLAAVLCLYGANGGGLTIVSSAVTAAVAGVIFLAIDRIIVLLTEIRDSLVAKPAKQVAIDDAPQSVAEPSRTAAEIDADLARMRQRLGQ
jgi:predicted ABC-type ATPase